MTKREKQQFLEWIAESERDEDNEFDFSDLVKHYGKEWEDYKKHMALVKEEMEKI